MTVLELMTELSRFDPDDQVRIVHNSHTRDIDRVEYNDGERFLYVPEGVELFSGERVG